MSRLRVLAIVLFAWGIFPPLASADNKIGFVSSERIIRETAPALAAQKRLENEFAAREASIKQMVQETEAVQKELSRELANLSESQRRSREKKFNDLSRNLQRRQREFREDLNTRRNEELGKVLDTANGVIREVAKESGYDIILQEAVYASPSIDITDKVIQKMVNER